MGCNNYTLTQPSQPAESAKTIHIHCIRCAMIKWAFCENSDQLPLLLYRTVNVKFNKAHLAVRKVTPRRCSAESAKIMHYMYIWYVVRDNWGEPERAPHRRDIHARIVYIYICMVRPSPAAPLIHNTLCAFQNIPRNTDRML